MRAAVAQRTKVVGNHGHTSTAQSELVLDCNKGIKINA
jgi:hypothetical protein